MNKPPKLLTGLPERRHVRFLGGIALPVLFMAVQSLSATIARAEGGREFTQNPNQQLPFTESFDADTAGEFPHGWNAVYLDDDHGFKVTDYAPAPGKPFTAPNALELFARGAPTSGFAATLYLIVPKANSYWLKFDFYFDPKDNYFRAGLGNSGSIQFGISAVDKRFFVTSIKDGAEVSEAIPATYVHAREWNTIAIGRDPQGGHVLVNGEEISIDAPGDLSMDYVKFIIGSKANKEAGLFIDNVTIGPARPPE